jgi:CBS domain-containing protein
MTEAIKQHGPDPLVTEFMRREFVTAEPRETLQSALARLQEHGCSTVLVVEAGRLIGLVTTENLAEVFMMEQALKKRSRSGNWWQRQPAAGNSAYQR